MKFYTIVLLFFAIALVFAQLSEDESVQAQEQTAELSAPEDASSVANQEVTSGEVSTPDDSSITENNQEVTGTSNPKDDVASNTDTPPAPVEGQSNQNESGITNTEQINGEVSDDYGDAASIDQMDGGEVSDINGEDASAVDKMDGGELSTPEGAEPTVALDKEESKEGGFDPTIAAGLAGAGALAGAGLLIWMKRSKRQSLDSVRRRISMV